MHFNIMLSNCFVTKWKIREVTKLLKNWELQRKIKNSFDLLINETKKF